MDKPKLDAAVEAIKADFAVITQKAIDAGINVEHAIIAAVSHASDLAATAGVPQAATPHIAELAKGVGVDTPNVSDSVTTESELSAAAPSAQVQTGSVASSSDATSEVANG